MGSVIGNMTKTTTVLDLRMMAISLKTERVVKREFGVTWWKPSLEDELRLLRLEQFSEKYKVSVEWILKLLVPIWKEKFGKFKKGQGLGVAVATLVGAVSERIIKEQLKKDFPEEENVEQWRAIEQQRQWLMAGEGFSLLEDWEHPAQTIKRYKRRMAAERNELRKFATAQTRRNYRNNPWK